MNNTGNLVKQKRDLIWEMSVVRVMVLLLSIILCIAGIVKFLIGNTTLFDCVITILSAFVFICIFELTRHKNYSGFLLSVVFSLLLLCYYVIIYREEFNLFSIETILFILIDMTLKFGDLSYEKMIEVEEKLEKLRA